MATFNNLPNVPTEDLMMQAQTHYQNWASLAQYSQSATSNILLDYIMPSFGSDFNTSSQNPTNIPNFNFSFSNSNNPLVEFNILLTLQGNGVISIWVNNKSLYTQNFQNSGLTSVQINRKIKIGTGNQQLQLRWQSTNGQITLGSSKTSGGNNSIQVINYNS